MTYQTYSVSYSADEGFVVVYEKRSAFRDWVLDEYCVLESFMNQFRLSLPMNAVYNWAERKAEVKFSRKIDKHEASILSSPAVFDWIDDDVQPF